MNVSFAENVPRWEGRLDLELIHYRLSGFIDKVGRVLHSADIAAGGFSWTRRAWTIGIPG
jgi:hypothetical protein